MTTTFTTKMAVKSGLLHKTGGKWLDYTRKATENNCGRQVAIQASIFAATRYRVIG